MTQETAPLPEESSEAITDLMVDQPSTELGGQDNAPLWVRSYRAVGSAAADLWMATAGIPRTVGLAVLGTLSAVLVIRAVRSHNSA